jgi:hypothetical protein
MAENVRWTVRLEAIDAEGKRLEMSIVRDLDRSDHNDFGLRLSEGKAILEQLQARIAQDQMILRDRACVECGARRPIHDSQSWRIQTLFGSMAIKGPRFRACRCKIGLQKRGADHAVMDLLPGRTTPEFDHVLAELGACHSFREAARIMNMFVPTTSKHNHTRVNSRLAAVADRVAARDRQTPYRISRSGGGLVSVFIGATYVRAVPGYQTRHFEVVMGRIETKGEPPAHFATMPNVSAARHWFHASMRVQHLKESCKSFVETDRTGEIEFKCAAAHFENMRSLLWRGKIMTQRLSRCPIQQTQAPQFVTQ